MTTLVWFRLDLRLDDNPALAAAAQGGEPLVPVFIFAPAEEGRWAPEGASRWWLHHGLARLAEDLERAGATLCLRTAEDSLAALRELVQETGARRIVWNRRYEPTLIARDRRIKSALRADGIEVETFNSALLREPWTIASKSGTPFQVFTPFWRHCKSLPDPAEPLPAPARLAAPRTAPASVALDRLGLLPRTPWDGGLRAAWAPGAAQAKRRLAEFLADALADYGEQRNFPGTGGTSRLSPHLHFGEIGPRQIWHAVRRSVPAPSGAASWRDSQFLAELGWREFAHHLLFHFPDSTEQPLRARFADFPWAPDAGALAAWQRGRTGYPIVDAGMRELWQSGWMHNRVRMIVASFLIKDLLQPWTRGAVWFWDTLVDADLASNTLGWQWVAGCGADAAPFFRIFNPVSQGQKFDPHGHYVRRWVPELAALQDPWLHAPWTAPAEALRAAGIVLGENYPQPIVEHEAARARALAAFQSLKTP